MMPPEVPTCADTVSGRACGLLATYRCWTCQQPMCESHSSPGFSSVKECTACRVEKQRQDLELRSRYHVATDEIAAVAVQIHRQRPGATERWYKFVGSTWLTNADRLAPVAVVPVRGRVSDGDSVHFGSLFAVLPSGEWVSGHQQGGRRRQIRVSGPFSGWFASYPTLTDCQEQEERVTVLSSILAHGS